MNISEELKVDLLKEIKKKKKKSVLWDQLYSKGSVALVNNDIQWIDYEDEKPSKYSQVLIRLEQKGIPEECFDYNKEANSFSLHDDAFVLSTNVYFEVMYYLDFADLEHLSDEEYKKMYPFPFFYRKGFEDNQFDFLLSSDYSSARYYCYDIHDILATRKYFPVHEASYNAIPLTKAKLSFFEGKVKQTRKVWIKPYDTA
jgi:hypothetical protein